MEREIAKLQAEQNNPYRLDTVLKSELGKGKFINTPGVWKENKRGQNSVFTYLDSFGYIVSEHKYIVKKKDLLNAHNDISVIFNCYPPNIIKFIGKKVWFYHGLEEGLMCWDSMDIRKLTRKINRLRKEKYERGK